MTRIGAWRVALRIARRDAWRHKARSALIIAMVAIPVLGLTGADVLARTMQLSPSERVTREIGQADAAIVVVGGKVKQTVDPFHGSFSNDESGSPQDHFPRFGGADYTALSHRALRILGATSSTVVDQLTGAVGANGLRIVTSVNQLALDQPVTRGMLSLQSGQFPRSANQVAVTSQLAERLGLHVGGRLTVDGKPRIMTAVVRVPEDLRNQSVFVLPGAVSVPRTDYIHGGVIELVQTRHPVSWSQVVALNAIGVAVASRAAIEHPPSSALSYQPFRSGLTTRDAIGVETVAIGMAILEVCLLAGAAFAVGARRQRHDLALLAAAGGSPSDSRRVVLSGGVLLGLVGAVTGAALGIALSPVALPYVVRSTHRLAGHFDLRPWEILGVMLLGVVTGVLAAVLPARSAARDDVTLALSGRRGAVRTARRIPVIGIAMIVLGIVVAYRATLNFHFRIILVGAVLSQLGFVLCAPALVGLVARLGRYLGLAPRLALRDAARHRGRSGPAVAAIMAAVSGAIAVSTYFATSAHNDRLAYLPFGRVGQATLYLNHQPSPAALAEIDATMRRDLGAPRIVDVPDATCVRLRARCAQLTFDNWAGPWQGVAVGGPELLRVLIARVDPAAEHALATGRMLVFAGQGRGPVGGRLGYPGRTGFVPLAGLGAGYGVGVGNNGVAATALISPATAAELGLRTSLQMQIAVTPTRPSQKQIDRVNAQIPSDSTVAMETGYHSRYSTGLIILAIAAAIVMLGATAISVGLSMAESKPDLVTLSAVGSRPMTRRLLVASQAGTVSLLGAAQGLVAGLIPAWAVLHALRRPNFTLPWQTMLLIVVAIPLLSMLGTAAFAGNRLILDRRAT
jgi:putative ABC transport system permease protein